MIDWIVLISQTGFPIAMVIYLMLRFEKVLNNNTEVILQLNETMKYRIGIGDKIGRKRRQ